MIERESSADRPAFRFSQLFFGLIIGAIIASAVFLTAGNPFSLNTATGQGNTVVQSLVVKTTTVSNPEVQVFVDQAYVGKIVNNAIKDEPNFSNAQVDLQPPNLALITLDLHINSFITVRPTATLAFEAADNKVKIQITEIDVGGFSVPLNLIRGPLEDLTQRMENRINALTDAMQQQTGLELTAVKATDMDLILNLGEKQPQLSPTP